MLRISYDALWAFFMYCGPEISYEEWCQSLEGVGGRLEALDLTQEQFETLQAYVKDGLFEVIVVDQGMSENHPGGDDILSYIDSTAKIAKRTGWTVVTWYGPDTEALAVGVQEGLLDLFEGEAGLDGNEEEEDYRNED